MPHVPAFTPQEEAALLSKRALQAPTQIALLKAYLHIDLNSDALVTGLLADILARAPALEQELAVLAHERTRRRREEQEMEENVTRTEPLFVRYDPAKHDW